jgi:hypothetical protein
VAILWNLCGANIVADGAHCGILLGAPAEFLEAGSQFHGHCVNDILRRWSQFAFSERTVAVMCAAHGWRAAGLGDEVI